MCGRVVWVWDAKTGMLVLKHDDRALDDDDVRHVLEKNRYNVPPMSHLPVIVGEAERTPVRVAYWGFPIPQRKGGVFNTRVETARTSPLWREVFGRSHCVLPVRGFYEWRTAGKQRVPHLVTRRDGEPMLLGGVTASRRVGDETKPCFSIVTCAPNAMLEPLHDRMPVVLEAGTADDWLHPQQAGADRVMDLAVPAGDVLAMHEVTTDVNNTDNDGPRLIEPVRRERWF